MSTQLKPIIVWGRGGPNPPKVLMILEELQLPYEFADITMADVKTPRYVAINPNGRLPSIQDPNTDITLWESGAIVEYLIERYDKDHRLSFAPGTNDAYHAKQWLFFQTTGQGPYYGQIVFFKRYHPEQLPSVIERFVKEMNRVTGVLESWLAQQKETASGDGPWLVGNRISYADIAFVPWQTLLVPFLSKEEYNADNYPHVTEWMNKMCSRSAIKKALDLAQQK